MKKLLPLLFVIVSCHPQSEILMTIDDRSISADEFQRIYNKNSSITIEEKKSVDEYLDLFINYKLKVIEAENLGYDTIPTFVNEMSGYTRQLAKPYLDKNSAMGDLVKEVYDRYTKEINGSHILIKVNATAQPADTLRVYKRIMEIRDSIMTEANADSTITKEIFDGAIEKFSVDRESKIGGDLGWFGAFRMIYKFEEAAYNTEIHKVSMPIRTMYGYHLVYVNGIRPNRGEVDARHIMTIIPMQNASDLEIEAARKKIDMAYEAIQNGAAWDSIARQYSEHKSTLARGGQLGWIKSGTAPEILLDSCFSLEPGEVSEVFRSEYGFHIVKTEGLKPVESYEAMKDEFEGKLSKMGDITKITEEQRESRIKKENGFTWNEEGMLKLQAAVDTTLYTGDWDPETTKDMTDPLFTIGDSSYTIYDAAQAVGKRRLSYRGIALENSVRKRAKQFMKEKVINYELVQLPVKYPEYGHLLQEYHDGILLFNLTEDEVWRKAVEDTSGLEEFYQSLPEKYQWEERIVIAKYSFSDSNIQDKIVEVAETYADVEGSIRDRIKEICGEDGGVCVTITESKYEKGDNAVADDMAWEAGEYKVSREQNNFVLYYVKSIIPPSEKTLEDARGLYTADYQTKLEESWVNTLRERYTITVDQKVLKGIIKEESKK